MKKKTSKLVLLFSVLGIAFSVFFCPASSLPVQAASAGESTVRPLSDDIRYRYAIFGNCMYKRLYNYTTEEWLGKWTYVCNVN